MNSNIAQQSTMGTWVCRYITDRNWHPVPVPYRMKKPVLDKWPDLRLTVEDVPQYYGVGRANTGILLAPSGLGDTDLDCTEARELADTFLPTTGLVFGRKSAPRSHRLYVPRSDTFQHRKLIDPENKETLLELRAGKGSQTIFPPSVHEEGEPIEWASYEEPAVVEPAALDKAVHKLAAACLLARHWPSEGSRQDAALALSGGLQRAGWEEDDIELFVRSVAHAAGDEEVSMRATTAEYTVKRADHGGTTTGWRTLAELVGEKVVTTVREWLGANSNDPVAYIHAQPQAQAYTQAHAPGPSTKRPTWPAPPVDEAFAGLAGRLVELAAPHTEADRVAVLGSFLTAFGCAVGSGPYTLVGATRHDPRIFLALVGRSGKARKGESWSPVRKVFTLADLEWATQRMLSGLSTGEGLISAVRDRVERTQPVKGTAGAYETVVVDEGELDKRLLVVEPELARVLKVMPRQGNTLSPVIRDAWDRGDLHVITKTPLRATGAHICLIGHVTTEELKRELTETDTANGFANRFVWLAVKRSQELPNPAPFAGADVERFAHDLAAVLKHARTITHMQRTPEANELWEQVYHDLSAERDGLAWAVLGRSEAQVLRLSMLYALQGGSDVITPDHLVSACALWDYSKRSVLYIFGDATGDPVADRIYQALVQRSPLSRTSISEELGRNVPAARIDQGLALLQERGKTYTYTEEVEGGRNREMWAAIP